MVVAVASRASWVRDACVNRIGLLHVDVRPHVCGERCGQSVEGEALYAIEERRLVERSEALHV